MARKSPDAVLLHERERFASMSIRQLSTRLGRLTDPDKLCGFVLMAIEKYHANRSALRRTASAEYIDLARRAYDKFKSVTGGNPIWEMDRLEENLRSEATRLVERAATPPPPRITKSKYVAPKPKQVSNYVFLVKDSESPSSVYFRIGDQSNRGSSFPVYRAPNGITIRSSGNPEWRSSEKILYVKGSMKSRDREMLRCTPKTWLLIQEAVEGYNREHHPHVFNIDDELFTI